MRQQNHGRFVSRTAHGRRRFIALASALSIGAAGLVALAPSATAANVSVSVDCDAVADNGSATVTSALAANDGLVVNYINCNDFSVTSTTLSNPPARINGNNASSFTMTAYTGSGSTLATFSRTAQGQTPAKTFTIVQPASSAPSFTSSAPAPATMNRAYSHTFTASGSPAPSFSVTAGSLPGGMTLTSGGLLSGTPTAGGTFSFTVTAANGVSPNATSSVQLSIRPEVSKVTICHRTRATTNPYVLITVSVNAIINSSGHNEHDTTRTNKTNPQNGTTNGSGPFNPSFNYPSNKKWWGDIIPPFSYPAQGSGGSAYPAGSYGGLNWSSNWSVPGATLQGGNAGYWITDADFAAAIGVNAPNDAYKAAVQQCIDLGTPGPSTQAQGVANPTNLFKKNRDNGVTETEAKDDLDELGPFFATPVNTTDINNIANAYQASVTTTSPTNVTQTSGTINGTLNALSGATWSTYSFNYYTGTDSPTSTGTTAAGGTAGPLSRSATLTGLTCGTTYSYQIVGTDSTGATYYGAWETFTTSACGSNNSNSNGNGGGNGNGSNAVSTTTSSPTPSASPSTLNRRPAVLLSSRPSAGPSSRPSAGPSSRPSAGPSSRPSASPSASTSAPGANAQQPSPSSTPTPSSSATPRRPEPPVTLNPVNIVPLDPGDSLEPTNTKVVDPGTGQPTTKVLDSSGTWQVNPNGTITFTPAPGFVGTATLNVQLSGRSGKLYIQPMSVRILATSRIALVTGDVPRSISAGVVRAGIVRMSAHRSPLTHGQLHKLTR